MIGVDFTSLIERDINGSEIGKSSKVKHSFNNFAQLDFDIGNVTSSKYQNLSVFGLDFSAKNIVDANTTFICQILIFNDTGSIQIGENEIESVLPGTVKFSVVITNWPFCKDKSICIDSSCCQQGQTTEIGNFPDFSMQLSSKFQASKNKENN